MAILISSFGVLLSSIFTILVFGQWLRSRRPHQLLWAVALLTWTLAVGAETVAAVQGAWSPLTYRAYYATGALMVAPLLGAGSMFLVASQRTATRFVIFVGILVLVGTVLIASYDIDATSLSKTDTLGFVEVKVFPLVPVRLLIIIGNALGTLAFVGSALYSVWGFRRRDTPRERMVGVLLIGLGGLVAAGAHSIGALGGPSLFRISELAALLFIFAGYAMSTFVGARTPTQAQTNLQT